MLPAPPSPPLETTPGPLRVLGVILSQLDSVGDTLREAFRSFARPVGKIQWKRHLSDVARAGADLIDVEPDFFRWLPYSATDLRTLERQIFQLGEIRSFLSSLTDFTDGLLLSFKADLIQKTDELLRGLNVLVENPMMSAADRDRLQKRARALTDIIEAQQEAVQQKRQVGRALRAERDGLATENEDLRAQLSAGDEPPPPAPRISRRRASR